MIFNRVLRRGFNFNRPFLMHPRIREFDLNFASNKDIVDKILEVLKTESEQNNHIVVKEGIDQLNFAMKPLAFDEKKEIVPVIVQYGNWFSSLKYYEGSIKCYSLALEVLKDRPDEVRVEEDLVSISLIKVMELIKMKNFQHCEKILQGLKKICDNLEDNLIKGDYYETNGIVNIMLGKHNEAIEYFEKAKKIHIELSSKFDTRYQTIMSTNYLSMLYSIRDNKKFLENFEIATENLLTYTDGEKEKILKCLEIWVNNLCFVEDKETFLQYFLKVEEKLESLPQEFLQFLYEKLIKFSESALKASKFNVQVYENYFKFAEKFLSEDVKAIERLCTIIIEKMLNDGQYGKVSKYATILLGIKKRYNDVHGKITVMNWMMEGYLGSREILSAKFLEKEIDNEIQFVNDPELKQQHKLNKLKMKNLVFNNQEN